MTQLTILERSTRAVLIGLLVCTLIFGALAWMPDSVFDGLISDFFPSTRSGIYKLSLQEFSHEKEDDKFQIFVKIQNVSSIPLEGVQAVITVLTIGRQSKVVVYPVSTTPILPQQVIQFNVTFDDNFPATRYSILFQYESGDAIPHSRDYGW